MAEPSWFEQELRREDAALAARRAPSAVLPLGWGGLYGEPPPGSVSATPVLYVSSGPVWTAVNAISNRVASTALRLIEVQGDDDEEEVRTHPALQLLHNPNEYLTGFWLIKKLVTDLLTNGNSYWFLAGPARGAPTEIWRLRPQDVRIVRDPITYIAGYVYEVEGQLVPLDRDEVIWIANHNPLSDLYGIGALAAAALNADSERRMNEWNRAMFSRDYAVPAGIVNVLDDIPDSLFTRMQDEWRASYGGGQRKTAFLRGGAVKYEAIGLNQTELDFLNGLQWQEDAIYKVFGAYHLLGGPTEEVRKNNERLYLEETIYPLTVAIAHELTAKLLPYFGSGYRFEFDDVRPRERALELDEQRERAKGLTLNEWRAEQNLAPLPGGDDVLFVHVQGGALVEFERAALPEPQQPAVQQGTSSSVEERGSAARPEGADEIAEEAGSRGDDVGDNIGGSTDKSVTDPAAIGRELAQWRKYVLRRLPDVSGFEPAVTPAFFAAIIQRSLDGCETAAEVKAVFRQARELLMNGFARLDEPSGPPAWPADSMKAIQATRLDFELDFADLLSAAMNGYLPRREWAQRLRTLLRKYGTRAYQDGLFDGGVLDGELDDDDTAELNRLLAEQSQYVTELGRVLFRDDDTVISDAQAAAKPAMWFNKSIMPMYDAGRLSADRNGMYEWVTGPSRESCESCNAAAGQVHRLRDWYRSGVIPTGDSLVCGGWQCACSLVRVSSRARGRLSRIPRKSHDSCDSRHGAAKGTNATHAQETETEHDSEPEADD